MDITSYLRNGDNTLTLASKGAVAAQLELNGDVAQESGSFRMTHGSRRMASLLCRRQSENSIQLRIHLVQNFLRVKWI